MPDYNKGKIYKIHCNITGEDYYGSTTQRLSQRINEHKKKPTISSAIIMGRCNYDVSLIEEYPCNTKRELEERETYYVRNFPCINNRIPSRTSKQYKIDKGEEYLVKNRETCKKWRENNREYDLVRKVIYRELKKKY